MERNEAMNETYKRVFGYQTGTILIVYRTNSSGFSTPSCSYKWFNSQEDLIKFVKESYRNIKIEAICEGIPRNIEGPVFEVR